MRGITGFGAYVPRLRLTRAAVAQAHSWNGGRGGKPPAGERAMCNWDEDVITMAVEAARDGLHPLNERGPASACSAPSSAEVPARWEPVISVAVSSSPRFSAIATTPAFWRSAWGSDVDAKQIDPKSGLAPRSFSG